MAIDSEFSEETMKNLLAPYSNKATTKNTVTISRVPTFITNKNKDLHKHQNLHDSPNQTVPVPPRSPFFHPQIVPIGPYHHGHDNFSDIEKQKHQYLHDFMERNQHVKLATYINKIRDMKDRADKCYNNKALSDDKFLQMLLLDGCFILELLFKLEADQRHRLCWAGSDFMTILSDLLLLENQIPFFVLKELYAVSKGLDQNKSQAKTELMNLVVKNLFLAFLRDSIHSRGVIGPLNRNINHLLHLYHEVSLPNPETKGSQNSSSKTTFSTSICSTVTCTMEHMAPIQKDHRISLVIPSASQLLEFGFVLRKQDSLNNSDAIIKNSTIKIPRLIIDSARKTLLLNLLSFERSLGKSKSRWTGLMVMMNCMIKNKRDLEILQNRGIVLNLLPNEDDAIEFFRQMSEQVIVDFNDHYYSDLFEKVNIKCEHFFRRHRAAFMHEYFNNRWAVISFCSSIIAIFLALVQTLVSVFTYRHRF